MRPLIRAVLHRRRTRPGFCCEWCLIRGIQVCGNDGLPAREKCRGSSELPGRGLRRHVARVFGMVVLGGCEGSNWRRPVAKFRLGLVRQEFTDATDSEAASSRLPASPKGVVCSRGGSCKSVSVCVWPTSFVRSFLKKSNQAGKPMLWEGRK